MKNISKMPKFFQRYSTNIEKYDATAKLDDENIGKYKWKDFQRIICLFQSLELLNTK